MPLPLCVLVVLPVALLLCTASAGSQSRWTFELGTGAPYNIPLPLVIHQEGEPELTLQARYSSEPFTVPISWIWRVGYHEGGRIWELQAVHHKLFLDNRPSDVEYFAVSHGMNFVTVNRGWEGREVTFRAGAGISLAHPENIVRSRRLEENGGLFGLGYYIAGPALSGGGSKCFTVLGPAFVTIEVNVFAGYASVPVVDGHADVWSLVLQASILFGAGT